MFKLKKEDAVVAISVIATTGLIALGMILGYKKSKDDEKKAEQEEKELEEYKKGLEDSLVGGAKDITEVLFNASLRNDNFETANIKSNALDVLVPLWRKFAGTRSKETAEYRFSILSRAIETFKSDKISALGYLDYLTNVQVNNQKLAKESAEKAERRREIDRDRQLERDNQREITKRFTSIANTLVNAARELRLQKDNKKE